MGILTVINNRAAALATTKAAPARPPGRLRAAYASMERWDIPDPAQAERQANLYANLSPLQSAIRSVANAVATTPFSVQKRTSEDMAGIKNHPFELRLQTPNDQESEYEFLVNTASWLSMSDECFWWLNKVDELAPPDELWVIPKTKIQPVPDGNMGILGYLFDNGSGVPVPLREWEVVHFKGWNPLNKYVGLSGLQALGTDATGDIGAQKYNANTFADGNIKFDGFLAFADYIDDPRWLRLQQDQTEQHGGTKNKRAAMLRGVGAGGVQWISTAMSRADMQYLEMRRFTKEEIFERFAPGLASILAINATEANSTAGKDTFREFAVYWLTVAIASKITQKLLPLYGENLVGVFEDVRRVDTLVELQTQEAYERTHTVEETRAKYYQDKPLGDERDKLLPAEVGKGMTDARKPEDKPPPVVPPAFGGQLGQPAPAQPDALALAQKRLDLDRWERKVTKALAAGRLPADVPFDPDYLTDGEAMPIRAALKRAVTAQDVSAAFGEG
jgi:phage portal protein BeeE